MRTRWRRSGSHFPLLFVVATFILVLLPLAAHAGTTLTPHDDGFDHGIDFLGLQERIGLILVHGLNGDLSNRRTWDPFLARFDADPFLQAKFKTYLFEYPVLKSQDPEASDPRLFEALGPKLGDLMDAIPSLHGRFVSLLAHSTGGLVARSFMEEWRDRTGVIGAGGEHTLRLVTLGTPHHGSPLADFDKGTSASLLQDLISEQQLQTRWDAFDANPYLGNAWLRCLNTSSAVPFEPGCPAPARRGFFDKVFAVGTPGGPASNIRTIQQGAACLAGQVCADKDFGLSTPLPLRGGGYPNNDGVVPLASALFENFGSFNWPVGRRLRVENCDHVKLAEGDCRVDGVPMFPRVLGPLVRLSMDKRAYGPGETMLVSLGMRPGLSADEPVDLFVFHLSADGSVFVLDNALRWQPLSTVVPVVVGLRMLDTSLQPNIIPLPFNFAPNTSLGQHAYVMVVRDPTTQQFVDYSMAVYEVRDRQIEPPACPAPLPVGSGTTVAETLTESDCRAPHRPASKADRYSFSGTAGQPATIAMASPAFDAYLILVGPDGAVVAENNDAPGSRDSRIAVTLPTTGLYTIEATSADASGRGNYTLTLTLGSTSVPCTPTPIAPGTISGSLTDTDCSAPHRPGNKADLYTFSAGAGQAVRITMNSSAFDPYLILVGPNGAVVAENDDAAGARNSVIRFTTSVGGTYTIEATAFATAGRGAYDLTLAVLDAQSCSVPFAPAVGGSITVGGNLTTGACGGSGSGGRLPGSAADRYTFNGTVGQSATITMTSTAFNTYLRLFGPNASLVAENDDAPGGGTNSQITATLPATGTYTIEASAANGGGLGPYSLTLTLSSGGAACTPVAIGAGTVSGTLTDGDCNAPNRPTSKADVYTFNGTAGQPVTIAMSSSAFDTYLILVGPGGAVVAQNDDSGGTLNSRITLTLPATGTYRIEATAFSATGRGAYTLSLTLGSAVPCAPVPIGAGTVGGNPSLTDSDCNAPHRPASKADLYTFSGTAGQAVTIAMSSSAFDTYLILVGPTGAVVAENDDTPGSLNSRIAFTLPSTGTYTIEATAFSGTARGPYALTLTLGATGGTCASVPMIAGTVNGSLADTDCNAPHRPASKADLYTFSGTAGQTVTIAMTSSAFDTYLFLVDPAGTVVAQNDDAGGTLNSRITVTLPSTGTYLVEATAFSATGRGAYALALTAQAPPSSCTPVAIGAGTVNGSLDTNDCNAPHRPASKADLYTFSATAGQAVTITMTSSAFDTYLILVGPGGVVVAQNDDSVGTNSRIDVTLPSSGAYTLEATAFSSAGRGAYALTLTLGAGGPQSCLPVPIGAGTVNGSLTDGDCNAPHRVANKGDLYTFTGTAGQPATITMASSAFDTYLILVGPTGAVLGQSDDVAGTTNSQITLTLPSTGTYTLEATAFSASGRGAYSLTLGFTGPCTATAIGAGTVNGSLTDGDCNAPHRTGTKGDLYTFSGTAGQPATITMSSSAFDTYLILVSPTGAVLAQSDDAVGTNSQIAINLPSTGTYTLEATAFSSSGRGAYSLTLSFGGACTATSIGAGTVNGSLIDGDCTAPHRTGTKADLYTFGGTAGQPATITMASSAFDTYLILVSPTGAVLAQSDDAVGTNSQIVINLPSTGTYTIEATAFSTSGRGAYSLTLSFGSSCTTTPIALGTVNGSLTDGDCTAPHRAGSKADLYTFSGVLGQPATITMMSSQFDTYLVLVEPNGAVVAQNDDNVGTTNSRITVTLPSTGTFTIEATAFGSTGRGAYSLTRQ